MIYVHNEKEFLSSQWIGSNFLFRDLCDPALFLFDYIWASENLVGPVDFNRPLARGPVEKNASVAACMGDFIVTMMSQ